MSDYTFKLAMFTTELSLPYDQAFPKAKEIGADRLWYAPSAGDLPFEAMTDVDMDRIGECAEQHQTDIFLLCGGRKFKKVHLCDLDLDHIAEHPEFQEAREELTAAMKMAARLKIPAVATFTFAWPGEYTAGKPTWPMRWMTRGGVISDLDMEKLVRAFALLAEDADRYDVDLPLCMMPWNYTNTTEHMRQVIEAVGSPRLKTVWGPADTMNCGESDTATRGFQNVRPYLHTLHIKDLQVIDGLKCEFEYCPIGEGDVDFPTVLRNLRDHQIEAVISIATHFRPESGSAEEAMRINFANMKALIDGVGD